MENRYPIADDFWTRLRGLAWREREEAGPGLLIPRCSSVHTFGMRFALDLHFLDAAGQVIAVRRGVPPRRFAWCRGAAAILEIPSDCGISAEEGGESGPARPSGSHASPTRRDRQRRRLRGRRHHP
jgi:uncharacterized protein